MRSPEEAQKYWKLLENHKSLTTLRSSIKDEEGETHVTNGCRSACWKIFLLFDSLDRQQWEAKLGSTREAYAALRARFLRGIEFSDELGDSLDPLSDQADSPWEALRKDESIRQEIYQDVERCMPDNLYFHQPETQNMLLDILFIWSKLNPDVGYRQGMHEVLAPILWVIERDAIDADITQESDQNDSDDTVFNQMFDSRFIGEDAFTLFNIIMQNVKPSYELGEQKSIGTLSVEAPMITRSKRIMEDYLARTDPFLAAHLQDIGIIPQVFVIRWVRLLFGREFPFDQVLRMWDVMFAEDTKMDCVDFVCVAMLLRIRWQLVEADYNTALSLLLKYPELPAEHPPATLFIDALYLKSHLDFDSGRRLIVKYTQREPPDTNGLVVLPNPSLSPPEKMATARPGSVVDSPDKIGGGLESILQDAAHRMYTRGEKWGVNQAVRDAVGEVRKNMQSLQASAQHRSLAQSRTNSGTVKDYEELLASPSSPSNLLRKIDALQHRNRVLAKMLEDAVNELWQEQKDVVSAKVSEDEIMKSFTLAVAKVQVVQVYLEDSTIPLPTEDFTPASLSSSKQSNTSPTSDGLLKSNIIAEEPAASPPTTPPPITASEPLQPDRPTSPIHPAARTSLVSKPHRQRPPLAQSSFSWMLGEDPSSTSSAAPLATPRKTFVSASPFTILEPRRSRKDLGFLFGDADDAEGANTAKANLGKGKDRGQIREEEEEAFRLATLKARRK